LQRPVPSHVGLRARSSRGFTLIEMALCCAIVGVIAAIAVPRMSSVVDGAMTAQADGSQRALQDAIDYYTAEHGNKSPAVNPDGSMTASGVLFMRRLLEKSDELGNLDPDGIYGPYLRNPPKNPFNKLATIRIGGAAHGSGAAAWKFDSDEGVVRADDPGVTTRKTVHVANVAEALEGGAEEVEGVEAN
jgi:prepilin-type N-terminal cleavage/methylation domain-containing protein